MCKAHEFSTSKGENTFSPNRKTLKNWAVIGKHMKRRVLLKRMAALGGAGAVAGCLSESDSPGGGGNESDDRTTTAPDESDDATSTPTEESEDVSSTPTATETPEPAPAVNSESIETNGTRCKQGSEQATVGFETESVAVKGAIESPDPCHEATLETVEYDPDADQLTVRVGLKDEDGACQSCLGMVNYQVTVGFDNATPGNVTVEHVGTNGEATTVTEATS
ncbi:MAG: hypothetical protein ACI9PP_000921 [Halobacteriales archaeon]